jgi:hypothetical protein
MISEPGYWKAKKIIAALEIDYAKKASKTDSARLWGHCDGMKVCLKILAENVAQNPEKNEPT